MTKKNIYVIYGIGFLHGMVFYGAIATLYRQAQGLSLFQITVIESISLGLCILLELPLGLVADKIGYKFTMVGCCFLYFVSKLVFWKASGFLGFLAERILLSVVISGLSGVDTSILYLSAPKEDIHRNFSIYKSLSTGGLLTATLGFSLFIVDDYKLAALLTVVTYGLATLLSLLLTEVKPRKKSQASITKDFAVIIKAICKNKGLLIFVTGLALFNETHQTLTVFLSQVQYEKVGISSGFIGMAYMFTIAIRLLGSLCSPKLVKLTGTRAFAGLSYGFGVLACLILTITKSPFVSVMGIVTLSGFFGGFNPLEAKLLNQEVLSVNRATELSVFSLVMSSVGIMTNLVFGGLAHISLSAAFALGAVFMSLGYVMVNQRIKKSS